MFRYLYVVLLLPESSVTLSALCNQQLPFQHVSASLNEQDGQVWCAHRIPS